jgi:hypothetical protein
MCTFIAIFLLYALLKEPEPMEQDNVAPPKKQIQKKETNRQPRQQKQKKQKKFQSKENSIATTTTTTTTTSTESSKTKKQKQRKQEKMDFEVPKESETEMSTKSVRFKRRDVRLESSLLQSDE